MTSPAAGEVTGFSALAPEYDRLSATHPVTMWMRRRLRAMVEARLPPAGSILELNAGSGLDAAYFAERGYHVHATDVADGMLQAAREKAARPECGDRMTVERRSFTDLVDVPGSPFDLVFSNLGGLNCIPDPRQMARGLPGVLRPGGVVVLVVMPPVCPWEMAQALRGHLRTAFRRFNRVGTLADVGGAKVRTWYHTAGSVRAALGPGFRVEAVRAFCLFAPPSYFHGFVSRHPSLTRRLMALDDAAGGAWPLNLAGDFVAVIARARL